MCKCTCTPRMGQIIGHVTALYLEGVWGYGKIQKSILKHRQVYYINLVNAVYIYIQILSKLQSLGKGLHHCVGSPGVSHPPCGDILNNFPKERMIAFHAEQYFSMGVQAHGLWNHIPPMSTRPGRGGLGACARKVIYFTKMATPPYHPELNRGIVHEHHRKYTRAQQEIHDTIHL